MFQKGFILTENDYHIYCTCGICRDGSHFSWSCQCDNCLNSRLPSKFDAFRITIRRKAAKLIFRMRSEIYTVKRWIKDEDGWITRKKVYGYRYRWYKLPKDVIKYMLNLCFPY